MHLSIYEQEGGEDIVINHKDQHEMTKESVQRLHKYLDELIPLIAVGPKTKLSDAIKWFKLNEKDINIVKDYFKEKANNNNGFEEYRNTLDLKGKQTCLYHTIINRMNRLQNDPKNSNINWYKGEIEAQLFDDKNPASEEKGQ